MTQRRLATPAFATATFALGQDAVAICVHPDEQRIGHRVIFGLADKAVTVRIKAWPVCPAGFAVRRSLGAFGFGHVTGGCAFGVRDFAVRIRIDAGL
jgi:hypothetical protein